MYQHVLSQASVLRPPQKRVIASFGVGRALEIQLPSCEALSSPHRKRQQKQIRVLQTANGPLPSVGPLPEACIHLWRRNPTQIQASSGLGLYNPGVGGVGESCVKIEGSVVLLQFMHQTIPSYWNSQWGSALTLHDAEAEL